MTVKRLAAIDIGSNSIRSIVVEIDDADKYKVLDDEKVAVRLGQGLQKSGRISRAAWMRAFEALTRLKKIIDGYGVTAIEAVATSAVRNARNGEAFSKAISSEIGIPVTVIGGEEEAELAALSAFHNFDLEGTRYLIADIGGGSLELVTAVGSHIEEIVSLELGAVYLTETFLRDDPITGSQYQHLRRHIRKTLKKAFADSRPLVSTIIGSGGTITAIAGMAMATRREAYGTLHRQEVLRSEIVHQQAMLLRKTVKERRAIPGLNPDRADIIVAGIAVVDELLNYCKANLLRVNERGIREGLILRGLSKHQILPAGQKQRTWRNSVLEFATSCHFDEGHSLQVARLSLEIFRALEGQFKFTDRDRSILEAAAILHDVGYFINYAGHHKHSYHLVRHADLFGFNPRERELIANVARYHRKSLPKKKHEQFMRLSDGDRTLVARLGGILRLADGLDRRRIGVVQAIDCQAGLKSFTVGLYGGDDLSVELFGARIKGDLFEEAFGLKLVLEPVSPDYSRIAS